MTTRADLDLLLRQLEIDIPDIEKIEGMNGFFREFEDRSEMILGVAPEEEQDYVFDCLLMMLRRSGISQRNGYKGPTVH